MIRIEEIGDYLRTTEAYHTDAHQARTVAARLLGWYDTWFYVRVARVIVQGAVKARRGGYTRAEWAKSSYRILRAAEESGARVSVSGLEHLRTPGPKVFVSNHMSSLETWLLPGLLLPFGGLATVIKESLLRYPFFGDILRACDPVSVTRRDPRSDLKTVLTEGERAVNQNRSVLLFPQTTRTVEFDAARFNSLGVKLAKRAGVPLVPLALRTDFMGVGKWVRDFGRLDRARPVCFKFGAPLTVEGAGRDVHAQTLAFIRGALRAWGVPAKQDGEGQT